MPNMRIAVGGATYHYNGKLMLPEAIAIEKATGLTQVEYEEKLQKGSALATAALIWILMRRADPAGTVAFHDLDYDTHAVEVTMLRDDGTPIDMEKVAARAEELIKNGMDRPAALQQARDEQLAPAAQPEPENPTAAGGTGEPAPAPTPSSTPLPPTPEPSPTISTSAPGSLTG